MADPFEVRMKFTSFLQHLNASVNSAQKAAVYAIRHQDMDEDLHSCILEQLERNNMNSRANIMFFIEHLCDMARRENHLEFVRMVQRDILRIIDAVAPSDGSGAANVKVVRRVLSGLQAKEVLLPETVVELEEFLKDRDTASADAEDPEVTAETTRHSSRSKQPTPSAHKGSGHRPDKRQIEQRIEEDRERHKRLRESIWAVNSEDNKEFEKLWEDTSDIGEDDFFNAEEDAYERQRAIRELDYNLLVGNAVAAAAAAEKEKQDKQATSNGADSTTTPGGAVAANA